MTELGISINVALSFSLVLLNTVSLKVNRTSRTTKAAYLSKIPHFLCSSPDGAFAFHYKDTTAGLTCKQTGFQGEWRLLA